MFFSTTSASQAHHEVRHAALHPSWNLKLYTKGCHAAKGSRKALSNQQGMNLRFGKRDKNIQAPQDSGYNSTGIAAQAQEKSGSNNPVNR